MSKNVSCVSKSGAWLQESDLALVGKDPFDVLAETELRENSEKLSRQFINSGLDPFTLSCLFLQFQRGCNGREAAELLGCTAEKVRMATMSGLNALRRFLDKQGIRRQGEARILARRLLPMTGCDPLPGIQIAV